MTTDFKNWKKINKPAACTQPPWAGLISPEKRAEVLRQIRQECIDTYGQELDECPNRFTCFSKECPGRPLPWKSETARPYLKKLKQINDRGDYVVNTDCSSCPFYSVCEKPCNQVLDLIDKTKTVEPKLIYIEDELEIRKDVIKPEPGQFFVDSGDIPWDVLTPRKRKLVQKYHIEQRDFRYVAESIGIKSRSGARYEFYAALTKLAKFGTMRKFLDTRGHELTDNQKKILTAIFKENKSITKTSEELGITKQAVQQTVARVIKNYGLKWHKFVKKRGGIPVYNLLELFKS